MSKISSLSFNIEDAQQYGVDEAILLYNLRYWIRENKAKESNIKNGRVWSYNTYKAWAKLFPFWGEQKIRGILTRLEEKKAIIVGNFHHNNLNRTKWYTLNDDSSICSVEQDRSVPENRTHGSVAENRTSLSYNYPYQTSKPEKEECSVENPLKEQQEEYNNILSPYYQWVFKNQLYKELFDTLPVVTKNRLWSELKHYEQVEGSSEAKDRFIGGLEKYRQSLAPCDDTGVEL